MIYYIEILAGIAAGIVVLYLATIIGFIGGYVVIRAVQRIGAVVKGRAI